MTKKLSNRNSLTVDTKEAPLFVAKLDDKIQANITIELWESIANEIGIDYGYRKKKLLYRRVHG